MKLRWFFIFLSLILVGSLSWVALLVWNQWQLQSTLESQLRVEILPLREQALKLEKDLVTQKQKFQELSEIADLTLSTEGLPKSDWEYEDRKVQAAAFYSAKQNQVELRKSLVNELDQLIDTFRSEIQASFRIEDKRMMKGVFESVSELAQRLDFLKSNVDLYVGKQQDVKAMIVAVEVEILLLELKQKLSDFNYVDLSKTQARLIESLAKLTTTVGSEQRLKVNAWGARLRELMAKLPNLKASIESLAKQEKEWLNSWERDRERLQQIHPIIDEMVRMPLETLRNHEVKNRESIIALIFAAILGFMFFGLLLFWRVFAPLESLTFELDSYLKEEDGKVSKGSEIKRLQDSFSLLRLRVERARVKSQLSALGNLASTLSHELKNPLAVAKLAVEDLGEGADPKEVASLQNALTRIEEVLKRHTNKNERGANITNAKDAAHDIEILYTPLFEKAQIKLEVDASNAGELPLDRVATSQVIGNLLINALEASTEGGRVILKLIDKTIEVHDQGGGFREENLAKVFEPGFTTKANGQGLGLPFVQELIASAGGKVVIEQSEIGGALVRISFEHSARG